MASYIKKVILKNISKVPFNGINFLMIVGYISTILSDIDSSMYLLMDRKVTLIHSFYIC